MLDKHPRHDSGLYSLDFWLVAENLLCFFGNHLVPDFKFLDYLFQPNEAYDLHSRSSLHSRCCGQFDCVGRSGLIVMIREQFRITSPYGALCRIAKFLRPAGILHRLPQPLVLAAHTFVQPFGKISRQAQNANQVLHVRQVAQAMGRAHARRQLEFDQFSDRKSVV